VQAFVGRLAMKVYFSADALAFGRLFNRQRGGLGVVFIIVLVAGCDGLEAEYN
jgi:hypothetical protein